MGTLKKLPMNFDNGIVARTENVIGGATRISGHNFSLDTLVTYLQEGMTLRDLAEDYMIGEDKLRGAYKWYSENKDIYSNLRKESIKYGR